MSIAVLAQVYDEMRRLAVAGSVTAGGDFRLKKLIPPLEQAGAKAPVFARVAEAVKSLVEGTEQTSAPALLELCSLVNAVLYTQGETGLAGDLKPLETTDLGPQTSQASARLLKPLLEALSTTGGGRLEIIKDSFERGAFRDLRLVKPALRAIDDPYPEIADFIAEHVLPLYGKAILPELNGSFDLKGRGGNARRLALMHRLDPAGTRGLVQQVLEGGSKELKIVAIGCLGDSTEDLAFLLEQASVKNKEVRQAALTALAKLDAQEAVDALQKALSGGDLAIAVPAARGSRDPRVRDFVIVEARRQLDLILKAKPAAKDKPELGKSVARLISLMDCLKGRADTDTAQFLAELFDRQGEIKAVKAEPGGQDVNQHVALLMSGASAGTRRKLVESHASLPPELLGLAFEAAVETLGKAELYEQFSPYLRAKVDPKKKTRDPAHARREEIIEGISYYYRGRHLDIESDVDEGPTPDRDRWDPRWLDLAVEAGHLVLVSKLARPDHPGSLRFLADAFAESLKGSKNLYDCSGILETMVTLPHPEATDCMVAALKKHAKSKQAWGVYWIGRLIPQLPKSAVGPIEEVLPTLDENLIDPFLGYVATLKDKA